METNIPSTEGQFASIIAAAITAGLTGSQFAAMLDTFNREQMKTAAAMSLKDCRAWFCQDAEAARILTETSGFQGFVEDFHRAAQELLATQGPRIVL